MRQLYGLWVIANIDHIRNVVLRQDVHKANWQQHEAECAICQEGKTILGRQLRNFMDEAILMDRIAQEEDEHANAATA